MRARRGAPKGGATGAMAPTFEADFIRISPIYEIFNAKVSVFRTLDGS